MSAEILNSVFIVEYMVDIKDDGLLLKQMGQIS